MIPNTMTALAKTHAEQGLWPVQRPVPENWP